MTRYTNGALPEPEKHAVTAKRWTVSSRGRKPTVGSPLNGCPTPKGLSEAVRPFQGRMLLDALSSVGFTHGYPRCSPPGSKAGNGGLDSLTPGSPLQDI